MGGACRFLLLKIAAQPPRLKIRHRLLTARSVTVIMRALRDARGDRPEPGNARIVERSRFISSRRRRHPRLVAWPASIPRLSDSGCLINLRGDNRKHSGVHSAAEGRPLLRPLRQCRTRSRADLRSARDSNTKHRPHPTTSQIDRCASRDASDRASKRVDRDKRDRGNCARARDCALCARVRHIVRPHATTRVAPDVRPADWLPLREGGQRRGN